MASAPSTATSVAKFTRLYLLKPSKFQFFDPRNLTIPPPERISKNAITLRDGVKQFTHIVPKNPSVEANKKRIGFFHPNTRNTAAQYNRWLDSTQDWFERTVKIFVLDVSAMHKVPVVKQGHKWSVQFERKGVWKAPATGWTFENDAKSRRLVNFATLDEAIIWCKELGLGFEIEYPHYRYHTRKNYGDNFKWRGPPPVEEDL